MKKSFFCLYSGLLLCMMSVCCVKVAFSQSTQMLQFKGLENKKGKLYIGWFQRDEDFTKPDKAVFSKIVPITGSTAATLDVPFDNIPMKMTMANWMPMVLVFPKRTMAFPTMCGHLPAPPISTSQSLWWRAKARQLLSRWNEQWTSSPRQKR